MRRAMTLRNNQLRQLPPERLLGRPAEDPLGRRIPRRHNTVLIHPHMSVVRRGDDRLVQRHRLAQIALSSSESLSRQAKGPPRKRNTRTGFTAPVPDRGTKKPRSPKGFAVSLNLLTGLVHRLLDEKT